MGRPANPQFARKFPVLLCKCSQLRANTKSVHLRVRVSDLFRQKMSRSARIANQKLYFEPGVVSCADPFQPGSGVRISWNLKVKLVSLVHQAGLPRCKAKPDNAQQADTTHVVSLDCSGVFWSTRHPFILVLVLLEQLDRLMSRLYTPRTFTKTSQKQRCLLK